MGQAGGGLGEAPSARALMSDFQATIDADPLALHGAVNDAFAGKADVAALRGRADRIEAGDLPAPGTIRFVEAGALGADNLGAYAADGAGGSGAIYLDERLIGDAALLRATFVEEMGHHVDALLGGGDAAGDEGAIFARRLPSGPLDAASLDALRSENDHGRIELDGASFAVEFRGEAGHPGGGTAPATDDDIEDDEDDESVGGPQNGTDDEPSYDPAPVPQNEPPIPGIQPYEPKPPGDAPPDLGGDEPPVDPMEDLPPIKEAGLGAVAREVIKLIARIIGGRGEPGNPGGGRPPSAEPASPAAGAPLPGPVTVPPVPPFPGVPPFDPLGAPVPPSPQEEFPDGMPGLASPLPEPNDLDAPMASEGDGPAEGAGTVVGRPTRPPRNANDAQIRSVDRENETAQPLADGLGGTEIEQNPDVSGSSNPDYRDTGTGRTIDCYAPSTPSSRNVASGVEEKFDKDQADDVVVNLSDTSVIVDELDDQLDRASIPDDANVYLGE